MEVLVGGLPVRQHSGEAGFELLSCLGTFQGPGRGLSKLVLWFRSLFLKEDLKLYEHQALPSLALPPSIVLPAPVTLGETPTFPSTEEDEVWHQAGTAGAMRRALGTHPLQKAPILRGLSPACACSVFPQPRGVRGASYPNFPAEITEAENCRRRPEPLPPRLPTPHPSLHPGCLARRGGSGEQRVRGRRGGGRGRRRRPALSHRRTDLGAYLLRQLPPPSPAPRRRPGSRPRLRSAGPRAPPPAPAPRERRAAAGSCPTERRGARPPGEEPEVINNSGGVGGTGTGRPPASSPPPRAAPAEAGREAARGEEPGPGKPREQEEWRSGSARGSEGLEPPQTHAPRTTDAHGCPWHRCGREERSGDTLEKVKRQPQKREETPATCNRQRLSIKNT